MNIRNRHIIQKAVMAAVIAPLIMASANCPTCQGITWEIEAVGHKYEYSPQKMVCDDPNTSEWECLTASFYTVTIQQREWIWSFGLWPEPAHWDIGDWVDHTYEPCFTDDTACGGNSS